MTLVSHVRLFVRQWNNFFVCFDICFFSFVFILEKDCKKELDNNAFIVSRRARPSFGVVSQVKFHLNRLVILWWLRFSSVKIGLFGFMKKPVLPPLLPVLRISGNLCSTEVSYFIDEKYICWKNRNSWNWHRKVEKGKVLRSLIKSTFTLTAVIADCRH